MHVPFRGGTYSLSSRVSPLSKQAGIGSALLAAGRAFVQALGRHGIEAGAKKAGQEAVETGAKELGEQVVKNVDNAAPSLLSRLTGWWDDGLKQVAKESEEFAGKSAQDIIHGLDTSILERVSTEAGTNLNAAMAAARQNIAETTVRLSEDLAKIPGAPRLLPGASKAETSAARNLIARNVDNATAQLDSIKSDIGHLEEQLAHIAGDATEEGAKAAAAMRGEISALLSKQTALESQLANLAQARRMVGKLEHAGELDRLLVNGQYDEVLRRMYSYDPNLSRWTADLIGGNVAKQVEIARRSLASASKNLRNPRAFLQEYVDLVAKGDKMGAEAFRMNPHNATMLLRITKRHPELVAQISKGELAHIPIRKSLVGLTRGQTAKRLGVGAGALAGGFGAVQVFDWFGNNDPKQITSQAGTLEGTVGVLKASGEGAEIVRSVQDSLRKIREVSDHTNSRLATESAATAAGEFYTEVSFQLSNLVRNLDKWDIVEQNAKNPQQARATGERLAQYVNQLAGKLNELRIQLGLGGTGAGVAGRGPTRPLSGRTIQHPGANPQNIAKIQGFLNLPKTGELTPETISSLQALEQRFNMKAGEDAFSGVFVVPEINHVISYNDLMKAYQKIQKY